MPAKAVLGRIVVAFDKFKGSLTAERAVDAFSDGFQAQSPTTTVVRAPIADGGDGTVDAMVRAGYERLAITVTGAWGEPTAASIARNGSSIVVEVANTSGVFGAPPSVRDALGAHTFGLGEAVRAALDLGADDIVVGLGGSASTDGGTGMVRALGGRFLDSRGRDLPLGGGALTHLERIDLSGLDPRVRDTRFVLAADVENPLVGASGSARAFAPQKGAQPSDVEILESGLARLAEVTGRQLGIDVAHSPGAGAAGGLGFGGLAYLGAEMDSGARVVLEILDVRGALEGADLLVTGEGCLDAQSLRGKAPVAVAALAAEVGVPTIAVVGTSRLDPTQAIKAGFSRVLELTTLEPDVGQAQRRAEELLHHAGRRVAL